MASVDNVGWDCRGFFMMVLQGGLGKICGKVEGTIHDNLFKQIIHTHTHTSYLALKCMGNHKVVNFWSKGQFINFEIFVGDTSYTRCLSYVTLHLLTVRIERNA